MANQDQFDLSDLPASVLLDALHDETVITDADGIIIYVNEPWRRFCADNGGDTSGYYVGANYFGICRQASGKSSSEAQIVAGSLERVLNQGGSFRCEYPCDSPTETRWFEMIATRLEHAHQHYLVIHHRNITKRKSEIDEINQAIVDSKMLAALVATTTDAILCYDLNGNIITWNRAAQQMYGYRRDEILGRSLEMLYPDGWPKSVSSYRDEIIAGRLKSFEATRIAKDGNPREVWISCAPIRGTDGEIIAISNIHRDVTDVRKAERTREIIAHEAIHRAKNMLSIVSSIQRQTAQTESTIEGFTRSFESRIRSLSSSTDLLVDGQWTTVPLHKLISGQLQPFALAGDPRVKIFGPPVDLQPQPVQMIGMALHELATNSAKYGALTQEASDIEISWSCAADNTRPVLRFHWKETCQVAPGASGKSGGFGRKVLQMLAPSMLNATSTYVVGDGCVEWLIDIADQHFELHRDNH